MNKDKLAEEILIKGKPLGLYVIEDKSTGICEPFKKQSVIDTLNNEVLPLLENIDSEQLTDDIIVQAALIYKKGYDNGLKFGIKHTDELIRQTFDFTPKK